ncbi:tetratricopeptide repeat protein [Leucobacter viscericola]|uniref:Tetratricopeptide repeat protein n=1 Tax=Leucobacter viscericola TaxID=2714935 RepID=A0A6G7XCJ1_9MICO|nr:tetratricopeptide repeat protein [Leucobacter viscericola]QIK62222.1 tetratricopeptide repeat protein [Leucobacter viscericola]
MTPQQMPERIPGGGIDLSHLAAARNQGAATAAVPGAPEGAPQVVDVPALVIDVTDAGFEQVAQLSSVVPVVVLLWAGWSEPSKALSPLVEQVTREFAGRVLLARVDVDANPGLAQAFQAQSIPTVVALVGGRPVPLFQGEIPAEQLRELYAQLLQLAEQQGVVGRVNAPADEGATDAPSEPAEPQIPPAHLAAVEAAERGDYAAAVAEWEDVLRKAPADAEARAALVQMKLLQRLEGLTLEQVRAEAAAQPEDLQAQLRVADLDLSGGHVEDAFLRLLELFAASDTDGRTVIRERLLELFEVVGPADPRVIAARGRLANLLY